MGRRIRYRPGLSPHPLVGSGGARENTFGTSQTLVLIGVGCIVVMLALVVGGYFVIQNMRFQKEFAPLVDVCRGKWVDKATAYSSTPGIHPAVAVRDSSSGWQLDGYLIPGKVLAQSLPETQLVLCMGKVQEVFIESCPYWDSSGNQYALERYYYRQEARLVEAKTGRVITVKSFTGKSAPTCQEIEFFSKRKKTERARGTEISDSEVRGWASTYLYIQ